jgi:MFS family permease
MNGPGLVGRERLPVALAAGFSAMDVATIALVGDAVPPRREAAFLGLRSTAAGLGGVFGPTFVGVVAGVAGYPTAFVVASLFAFAAAALLVETLSVPAGTTDPDLEYRTVETTTGIGRPPGVLRGPTPPRDEGTGGQRAPTDDAGLFRASSVPPVGGDDEGYPHRAPCDDGFQPNHHTV